MDVVDFVFLNEYLKFMLCFKCTPNFIKSIYPQMDLNLRLSIIKSITVGAKTISVVITILETESVHTDCIGRFRALIYRTMRNVHGLCFFFFCIIVVIFQIYDCCILSLNNYTKYGC